MPSQPHNLFADIELALHEDVSVTLVELARTLGTDRHNIERAVHLATGVTFRQFKKQKKLERATTLLNNGLYVKEIAEILGYSSPTALTRFIKNATGHTPRSMKRWTTGLPQV